MAPTLKLIPSLDLVHRVLDAATTYTLSRIRILESIPGNPFGIACRITDNLTALSAQHLPVPAFNSVTGRRKGQAHLIRPLVEWYHERGVSGRFEIASGDDDPALGQELAQLGFFQSRFSTMLIREPDPALVEPIGVEIDPVTTAAGMQEFLAAYVEGWGIPEAVRDEFKQNVGPWLGQPGWSLYVARAEGRPAAAAILFVHDGVGYFADCATDPAFRRRRLHAALLHRRLRDASRADVDFVCSGADFLSTSHRNMERAGMRILFLRSVWTRLDRA